MAPSSCTGGWGPRRPLKFPTLSRCGFTGGAPARLVDATALQTESTVLTYDLKLHAPDVVVGDTFTINRSLFIGLREVIRSTLLQSTRYRERGENATQSNQQVTRANNTGDKRCVATQTDALAYKDQKTVKVTRYDQLGRERLSHIYDTKPTGAVEGFHRTI